MKISSKSFSPQDQLHHRQSLLTPCTHEPEEQKIHYDQIFFKIKHDRKSRNGEKTWPFLFFELQLLSLRSLKSARFYQTPKTPQNFQIEVDLQRCFQPVSRGLMQQAFNQVVLVSNFKENLTVCLFDIKLGKWLNTAKLMRSWRKRGVIWCDVLLHWVFHWNPILWVMSEKNSMKREKMMKTSYQITSSFSNFLYI